MDAVELICQIDNLEWDGSTGPYWPPMHTINKVDIGKSSPKRSRPKRSQ